MSVRIPDPQEVDLVLYHAGCTDGFTAAWAAWEVLGDEAEYIHVQYGTDPPDVEGRKVAIVDFSYPREQLQEMAEKAEALVVLDHHKSAQKQLDGLDYAQFDLDKSGAVLSWEFFHPNEPVPKGVLFVQDRDLWNWDLPSSKEYSAGLGIREFDFEVWREIMLREDPENILSDGSSILQYIDNQVGRLTKKAVLVEVNGQQMWMVNASNHASEIGHALCDRDDDVGVALIWFYEAKKSRARVCSLRSREGGVDVGAFASKFHEEHPQVLSGGGHPGAAGFLWDGTIEELITFVGDEPVKDTPVDDDQPELSKESDNLWRIAIAFFLGTLLGIVLYAVLIYLFP